MVLSHVSQSWPVFDGCMCSRPWCASLSAQTPAAPAAASGTNPSRVDVFLGYSYFGTRGKLNPAGISYSSINEGMIASGAYYFNRYLAERPSLPTTRAA